MPDTDADSVTRSTRIDGSQTTSPTLAELTEKTGDLNNRASILHDDTKELHQDVITLDWQNRSSQIAKKDVASLLSEISDWGFSWRDVARLLGVSVPALQKWRRGERATGSNRGAAAALVAACKMIQEHYLVEDIASWFETPVLIGAPVTPIDLYVVRGAPLVLQYASGKVDPEQVLTIFDPEWREKYRSDFEVFETDDGLAIRPKER